MNFGDILNSLSERDKTETPNEWPAMTTATSTMLVQQKLYHTVKNGLEFKQQELKILNDNSAISQSIKDLNHLKATNNDTKSKIEELLQKKEQLLREKEELTKTFENKKKETEEIDKQLEVKEHALNEFKTTVKHSIHKTHRRQKKLDEVMQTLQQLHSTEETLKAKIINLKQVSAQYAKPTQKEEKPQTEIPEVKTHSEKQLKAKDRLSSAEEILTNLYSLDHSAKQITNHTQAITRFAFANTNHFLATGSEDTLVNVYNSHDYTFIKSLKDSVNTIMSLKFCQSDKLLMSASWKGVVRFYQTPDFRKVEDLNVRQNLTDSVFITDSKFGVSTKDQKVKLYEIGTSLPTQTLSIPSSANKILSQYGDSLITAGCLDGHIRRIDTRTNQIISDIFAHKTTILDMQVDNANQLITFASDRKICTIDPRMGAIINVFNYNWIHKTEHAQIYVRGEESVLVGDDTGYVHELNLMTNKEVKSFKAHDAGVTAVSRRMGILVTGDAKGVVKFWSR